jgi:arabinofuranosyltransferase
MRPFPRPGDAAGVVLLLVLAGLGALVAWGFFGYSYDDAFITYRYARNWAEGAGLVFNPGERVLGTTAPGFALLLGLLSAATGVSVPAWGTLLAVASLATVALVLRSALAGAPPAVRAGAPLLFAATTFLLQWNIEMLGAETFPVLAFGVTAAHLALDRNRQVLAGLLIFAAMACRLDAGLLAAILGLALWRQRRSFPWAFALAGLLPLAVYLGWLQTEFGAIVPNTMAAKQSELKLVEAGYSYTLREWRWLRRGVPLAGCLALLGCALWALGEGARAVWRRQPVPGGQLAAVLGLWLLGHEVAYRFLEVPFAPWYHVPLMNGLLGAASLGAVLAASRLPGRLRLVGAAVLLLPLLIPSATWVARQLGRPPDPRWTGYVEAARRIRETGGSVAAVEIGFLGYFSEAHVLDLMGLVSPEALEARQRGDLADLVARERPDYLLDVSLFRAGVLGPVLADPRIAAGYEEVGVIEDGRIRLLALPPE